MGNKRSVTVTKWLYTVSLEEFSFFSCLTLLPRSRLPYQYCVNEMTHLKLLRFTIPQCHDLTHLYSRVGVVAPVVSQDEVLCPQGGYRRVHLGRRPPRVHLVHLSSSLTHAHVLKVYIQWRSVDKGQDCQVKRAVRVTKYSYSLSNFLY